MERIAGIEPASFAWKAIALPLSYTRINRRGRILLSQESIASQVLFLLLLALAAVLLICDACKGILVASL